MDNRYTVSAWHGESRSVFHVLDKQAPEEAQPLAIVTLHDIDKAREVAATLNKQAARIAELEAERIEILQERRDLRTRCIDIKRGAVSRIAELEGALLDLLAEDDGEPADETGGACLYVHGDDLLSARRVLGEGSAK